MAIGHEITHAFDDEGLYVNSHIPHFRYSLLRKTFTNFCCTITTISGGFKGGAPPRSKIFPISCSFLENLGKIVGWRPLLREILDPPLTMFAGDC